MSAGFFERRASMQALQYRDFRLLLAGTTLVGILMPLQFLTQVFWVQQEYVGRTVLYTALIAASRGLAMLLFALIGGALADRYERRMLLILCESASGIITAVVAVIMITNPFGHATIAAVCALSFLSSGVMSIDQPARQASIPAVVGMKSLGNAVSLNALAMQMTLPLSLPLVGLLNTFWSPGTVYLMTVGGYAVIVPLLFALRFRSTGTGDRAVGMVRNIAEGMRYSWRDPTIFGVIAIVFVVQVVGMPGVANPLGPVWMTEILGLSEAEFGFMAMTWGIGAMAASLMMARFRVLPQRGSTLCVAAFTFAFGILLFGYSRYIPLTIVANFALGAAFAVMLVASTTIIQSMVADEMRGRVLGLFPLTMGLAQLNAAPVGGFGQWLGLPVVVPALGWITLALCALVLLTRPQLRSLTATPAPEVSPAPAGGR